MRCPDRAHHHVPPRARGLRGLEQLHRRAQVDGLLSLRTAAGTGSGGEHDGVGAFDEGGQVLLGLHVAHHRLRARGLEVAGVVRIADQAPRAITALGEEAQQLERDLTMATGDDDIHGSGR